MSEELQPSEIRPQFTESIDTAEKVMQGHYNEELPDEDSMDPAEVFMGPLLDLNDETLTDQERSFMEEWIASKLGASPDEAAVRARYQSEDGATTVTVFDVPFGEKDLPWYISRWQNEGEKPSFIFWSEEMYDEQLGMGYSPVNE